MGLQDLTQRLPIEPRRFALLVFAVVCQLATILITWPLWTSRVDPPNLPTFPVPEIDFAWPLIATLVLVLFRPREGVALHWLVLVAAAVVDQYRLQPQFFAIALMMAACVWPPAQAVTRWFIASTWTWAGLHKLLSPDWLGHSSHWLLELAGVEDPLSYHVPVAVSVAVVELVAGVLACVKPKWAAIVCVPMHLGIIATLSPLVLNWNMSVVPWNLCMAVIGYWVLINAESWKPGRRWEWVVASAWMLLPACFYLGITDHGFSGVLYSDWIPRGQITTPESPRRIVGWGRLAVPFPNERRTLRMFFEQAADPGDKLHIADPRRFLADQYFVLNDERNAIAIDIDTFFTDRPYVDGQPSVMGVAIDEERSVFALRNAGVRMVQASASEPIYAVAFTPQNYSRELLKTLSGLPNLQQIQLAGTGVTDDDLALISSLRLLTGIGLEDTKITDSGLQHLRGLPYLQYIEHEGTKVTEAGIASVLNLNAATDDE